MHRGELDLEKAPLALHEAVHAGVSSAATLAADKQLTLDVEARQDLPIEGDRLRLAEAVTHLVTNAVALSPAGGRVHVWCGREAAAPTIRVSAEGLLTKPRTRERASASARRLALARHIVERHGGELREHRSGAGHAAVVRLPDPEGRRPRG